MRSTLKGAPFTTSSCKDSLWQPSTLHPHQPLERADSGVRPATGKNWLNQVLRGRVCQVYILFPFLHLVLRQWESGHVDTCYSGHRCIVTLLAKWLGGITCHSESVRVGVHFGRHLQVGRWAQSDEGIDVHGCAGAS